MFGFKRGVSRALIGFVGAMTMGLASERADAQYSFKDELSPAHFFTWTGFYVGLNGGGHWSNDNDAEIAIEGYATTLQADLDLRGFIGGGQIGFNWESGIVVVGIEADIQGVDAKDTFRVSESGPGFTVSGVLSRKLEWLGTVRGRFGVTPSATTLLYATGGFAYGGVELSAAASVPGLASDAQKSSETATGWTVGGGAEFLVWSHTILRGEYLYYDLGEVTLSETVSPGHSATAKSVYTGNIARLGISYKF